MSPLAWLPADARITEVLPDRWHVRFDNLPLFGATLLRGGEISWLVFAAGLPRAGERQFGPTSAYLNEVTNLQDEFPGVKVVLPTAHGHSTLELPAELRVELPLPATAGAVGNDTFALALFEQFAAALARASAMQGTLHVAANVDAEHMNGDLADTLADLDYVLTPAENNAIRVDVPIADVIRPLCLSAHRGWLRAEILLGDGAVRQLIEPMRTALLVYLLRVSGCVKLARASSRVVDEKQGRILSFVVDLPMTAGSHQIDHAIRALATATRSFEVEIDNLATEAILAHAYLTTTGISPAGSASRAATTTTVEL